MVRMMKIVIWRSRDHVKYTEYLKSDEGTIVVEYLRWKGVRVQTILPNV